MLPTEVANEVVRPALVGTCFCFTLIAVDAKSLTAEEVVGRRQFSDQLVIPEPFVEDELAFPSILHIVRPRRGDEPRTRTTQIGAELKKRLTADFELSLGGSLLELSPDGKPTTTGFGNLEVGLKYQFLRDPSREAVASIALNWEVGGTGRAAAGAESFDTFSPSILAGKGFGDLPDRLAIFRPSAVAGVWAPTFRLVRAHSQSRPAARKYVIRIRSRGCRRGVQPSLPDVHDESQSARTTERPGAAG
ncbi:MAG: hypothetical protein DMD90_28635 [Candidatus Rokuibacteriota bacterium]|nr:MAG: hypothetical protein DMD90_28635 [Candidatus Rokubacteria bacterium]